ncbi:MAG: hypothetical protein KDA65_14020, partial [Planctomycetaceae bacterium]|nr:hypothetical protein [Planctomycetaceae bacterium]
MSSNKYYRKAIFTLALSTLSCMTLTVWAAPPPSRPAPKPTTPVMQKTVQKSRYSQLRHQTMTVRPQTAPQQTRGSQVQTVSNQQPVMRNLNQPPRLMPVPQSHGVASTRSTSAPSIPKQTNSPFGVMKDELQTVAGGGSRPTGRTSEINAELRKLYEADGREMPDLPAHRPQAIPTPQAQNAPANTTSGNDSFESDNSGTYYRPNYLSAGKNSRAASNPRSRSRSNGRPNAFKRFFGKLGIGSQDEEEIEEPVVNTTQSVPQQPSGFRQPQQQQQQPQQQQVAAQPQTANPTPQTQSAQQQPEKTTTPQKRLQLSPTNKLNLKKETKFATQETDGFQPFGAELDEGYVAQPEAQKIEPAQNVPEELLVQEPARVEEDLMNAFGEGEEEPLKGTLELNLEPIETEFVQEQPRTNTSPEAAAEVPVMANDNEPIRLELKADNGQIEVGEAAPVTEPAEL